MGEIIKISAVSAAVSLVCVLIRQYKPEYALMAEISAVVCICIFAANYLKGILENLREFVKAPDMPIDILDILIKALLIAVITGIASDFCRDSSNSALASSLELAGKGVIAVLAIPLLKEALFLALSLLS